MSVVFSSLVPRPSFSLSCRFRNFCRCGEHNFAVSLKNYHTMEDKQIIQESAPTAVVTDERRDVNELEDRVLQYLATHHPEDEKALTALIDALVGAREPSEAVIDRVYKGLRYDVDVAAARSEGFRDGRNAQIDERLSAEPKLPRDDGGLEHEPDDLPLLRHISKSVWDL